MKVQLQDRGTAARSHVTVLAAVALGWLCLVGSVVADGGAGERFIRLAAVGDDTERPDMPGGRSEFDTWVPRALAGDPEAAYRLGQVYVRGAGRKEDLIEAAHWFRKAAEAGHAPAQLGLATLYGKGKGVAQDYVQSYVWFAVAADNREYGLARDQALELRNMMAAFLTPEQRAEAERLAAEWQTEVNR